MELKKKLQSQIIYLKQKRINYSYKRNGFSTSLLEKQIALNVQRNDLDIADKHEQKNGEYVQ